MDRHEGWGLVILVEVVAVVVMVAVGGGGVKTSPFFTLKHCSKGGRLFGHVTALSVAYLS